MVTWRFTPAVVPVLSVPLEMPKPTTRRFWFTSASVIGVVFTTSGVRGMVTSVPAMAVSLPPMRLFGSKAVL